MIPHPLWHVCGIGLFLALAAIHRRTRSSGIFVVTLWNLTGVFLHELAHLMAGTLLRAHPAGISLWPYRTGRGWRLGSVRFSRITAVNAVPVALAPLGLAAVAWLVAENWFYWWAPSLATTLSLYGVLFILLYNALPSREDIRIACNARSLLLYGPLLAAVAWYLAGDSIASLSHRLM